MSESAHALLHQLRTIFQFEAAEHIKAIVNDLAVLAHVDQPGPVVERILRTLHTLKGAARAVELGELEQLCHAMEELCAAAPQAGGQWDLLHQACTLIPALVADPTARTRNQSFTLVRELERLAFQARAGAAAPGCCVPEVLIAEPVVTHRPAPATCPSTAGAPGSLASGLEGRTRQP